MDSEMQAVTRSERVVVVETEMDSEMQVVTRSERVVVVET